MQKRKLIRTLAIALALVGVIALSRHGSELVQFPENYAQGEGVRYATIERGNIREEIYTGRAAIDAAKRGQPLPNGTVITLVDYRDGKLFRYVVMEKREGKWKFQAFNTDKSVNHNENLDRCMACHQSVAQQDFVFTLDRMKSLR